jgi:uncharacterized protein YfdQ (DUF2303 family)
VSDLTPETIDKIRSLTHVEHRRIHEECSPFIVIPNDCKIETLGDYSKPAVIKANPFFKEVGSFIEYVLAFADEDTLIFANPTPEMVEVTAIIDYHRVDYPAWCKHRATFKTQTTPEYQTWMAANRKQMNQVDFATWLEDNATLLVEPTGAELLELVRALHGHKNARFGGEVRLATGNYSVSWEEETVVKATPRTEGGVIEFPRIITAGIAPFYGAKPYAIQARLKTKVEDRKLSLWFETVAPHVIIRDSITLLCQQIRSELKRPLLIGAP